MANKKLQKTVGKTTKTAIKQVKALLKIQSKLQSSLLRLHKEQ